MIIAIIVSAIVLSLLFLWWLSTRGRKGHPELHTLRGWSYAHRGLHGPGVPENSMAAFQAALEHGYGIELDIHLLKDGNLAVIHDSALLRTTGLEGDVENLTTEDLKYCHLEGTDQTIPLFRDVLALYQGKRPLIIELKVHKNNVDALCRAACSIMEGYEGAWCMESFNPRVTHWLKKNRPEIIRGQLTENYSLSPHVKVPKILKWLMKHNRMNFLTRPDFVAYRYRDRHSTRTNRRCMKRMAGVSWTLQSQEEFDTAVAEGWIPIFEGFLPDSTRREQN